MKANSLPRKSLIDLSQKIRNARLATVALALVGIGVSPLPLQAATVTWTGPDGGDWGAGASWTVGTNHTVPAPADTALFNTGMNSVTVNSGQSVTGISFDTNAGAAAGTFTIGAVGSGTVTLGTGGTAQILSTLSGSGKTFAISAPLVLGAGSGAVSYTFANGSLDPSNTLRVNSGISAGTSGVATLTLSGSNTGNNTVSGNISNGNGTVAVTMAGPGKWILSGSNTYSGATTINGGALELDGVNSSAGNTALVSGTVILGSGSNGGLAGGTLTITSGQIMSSDNTARTIGNAVALTTNNGFVVGAAQGATTGLGDIAFSNTTSAIAWQTAKSLIVNNNTTVTLAQNINTAALVKGGIGTLVLTGSSQYGVSVTEGTVRMSGTGTIAGATAGGILNGLSVNGGTFDLNGTNQSVAVIAGNGGTIVNNGSGTSVLTVGRTQGSNGFNFGGNILDNNNSGAGKVALVIQGRGAADTQVLAGNNSYSGGTTLVNAEASIADWRGIGTGGITFSGGALQITGTSIKDFGSQAVTFTAGAMVYVDIQNAANTFTIDKNLNQTTGGFQKSGAGTVVLTGSSSYRGTTVAAGGVLMVDAAAGGALSSSSGLTFNGGTFYLRGAAAGTSATMGAVTLGRLDTANGIGLGTGGVLVVDSTNGGATTLSLGNISTNQGGTLNIVTKGTSSTVKFNATTTNGILGAGRIVLNGSDWATNSGANTATTAFSGYVSLPTSAGSASGNYIQTGSQTFTGDVAAYTLKIADSTAGSSLDLGGNKLTLTGGLLGVSSGSYAIKTGTLTSSGNDIVIHQYGTGDLTIGANIIGNATLTKAGTGTLILTGVNTYSGGTLINDGVLSISNANQIGTGAMNISGGTLAVTGNVTLPSYVRIFGSGGTFDVTNGATLTMSAAITTGAVMTVASDDGTGTVNLNTSNTLGGGVMINGGTLLISNVNALSNGSMTLGFGDTSSGRLKINGYSITVNGVNSNSSSAVIENGSSSTAATLSIASGNNDSFAGVIRNGSTAALSITKSGAGTQTLSGNSTYTGKTSIANGALKVSSLNSVVGGAASSNLGAPITVANGTIDIGASGLSATLIYTGAGETTDRVINLAGTTGGAMIENDGSGALVFSSSLTATGLGVKTLTLQGTNTAANTLQGSIVDSSYGSTSLVKDGVGTWVLSGLNSYTGKTTISNGSLQLGNGGIAGSLSTLSAIIDNGNLTINRSNAVVQGVDFSGDGITGTGSFTQLGSGTTTLTSVNTFTGDTTISGGQLDVNGSLASGTVSVSSGAALGGRGTVSGIVKVDNGFIRGSGLTLNSVTFSGASTLAGSSTASNGFTVASGTLNVQGTTTSRINVNSGIVKGTGHVGDIALSGTLSGTLKAGIVGGNGLIAPGNGPGILTIAGLEAGNALSFNFELAQASPNYALAEASGNSILHIADAGGLSLSNNNTINIFFSSLTNLSAENGGSYEGTFFVDGISDADLLSSLESANIKYYVVDADGVTGGDVLFGGTNYTALNSSLVNFNAKAVSVDFGSGIESGSTLEFTVVPEPATWAEFAAGMVILGVWRRFRRFAS